MRMVDRIARVTLHPSTSLETRRTGLAFLCLIVTTNLLPWLQLSQNGIDSRRPPSPSSSVAVLSCLLAAVLVIAIWLLGRRLPVKPGRLTENARDAGLLLALLTAGANLALAVFLQRRAFGSAFAGSPRWFGPIWFGLVLPTELAAAFFKGRASIPAPRLSPSGHQGQMDAGEPLSN
jgi:hypothetical protein